MPLVLSLDEAIANVKEVKAMNTFIHKQNECSFKIASMNDYSHDELVKMFELSEVGQRAKRLAEERHKNESMSKVKAIWG